MTRGFMDEAAIADAVARAAEGLWPDVVTIRFSLGGDWSGDPAVFFRVVLSDHASEPTRLLQVTRRVAETLVNEVRPAALGLLAYFNYRSASEQAQLKEEAWA